MHWFYLAVAIVAEVIATSALKASEGFTRALPVVVVAIGYGVAFYFLSLTLKTLSVGIAYAVWSGLGVVLVSLVGAIFLGQSIDLAGGLGIGLIVAGVAVLNLFSTVTPH